MVEVDKSDGRIRVSEVMAALKSHTCLVTIMMANNETGVIQVRERRRRSSLVEFSVVIHK